MIDEMSEQEGISYSFNRLGWLRKTRYLLRPILFLDLNHWINLAEKQDKVYRELSETLHEAVDAGKLVCPVSPSLLMEVEKRPLSDKRDRYCQLMDRLSGKLSLRNELVVFAEEFRARGLDQQIERQIAYSFFIDAMSTGSRLEFPEGWTEESAEQAAKLSFDRITSTSISQAVNMFTEEQRDHNISILRNGWSQLAQQAGEWREQNEEVSAREIERAEFASTVDALVPHLAPFFVKADRSVLMKLSLMSDDEKREMLMACPTFWCRYKLLAAIRAHKKTLKENDLWDLQHVLSAAPYVDCLACDRGTWHMCTQLVRLDEKYETKIISKPDEILTWIRNEVL